MIRTSRIASGVANSLLESAKPTANPKPIIEDAFRRGFELGLSVRSVSRGCPTRRLLFEKEARHGPC
jgi:hypothetical protein